MPNESPNTSLLETVIHMIDRINKEGTGYDTLIHVLSLLCLLQILHSRSSNTRLPTEPNIPSNPGTAANPLQKLLGDLTKGGGDDSGGGPSPDILMSLLPLLNSPQVKSKLNPANISNILGMMTQLGGNVNTDKNEKKEPPAATVNHPSSPSINPKEEQEKKELGRSLNWKTNFHNEKEV